MGTSAAVASLLAIILLILKQWQAGKPKRDEAKRNAEIQKGRTDIQNGDAGAVAQRIDKLCGDSGSGHARLESPTDAERRIREL